MLRLLMILMSVFIASPVYAYPMLIGGTGCTQQTATLTMNITLKGSTTNVVQDQFDEKMKAMADYIKDQKIDRFSLQSMTYNINTQQNPMSYNPNAQDVAAQLTSNATYQLPSPEDAFKLAQFLTKKQFIVNVSVNRNSNMPCPPQETAAPAAPPAPPSVPSGAASSDKPATVKK